LATAHVDNAAATRAYLRASEAYAESTRAETTAIETAIRGSASQIAGECPSALTYVPRDTAFVEIDEEIGQTLYFTGAALLRAGRYSFVRAIGGLRWSDARLSRLVAGLAAQEAAAAALTLPNVCADIDAWKASAYATLPSSASAFLARADAVESASYVGPSEESREVAIMRLLKPYEGPDERRAVKLLERQERHMGRALGAAVEAGRARLAAALGVSEL
jgi:hypothetical protein